MIDGKMLSLEEKDKSINWILDNGMPEKRSVLKETVIMVKAMGVKPFFGLSEGLLIGLLFIAASVLNISIQTYENQHVMQLFLFLSAPLFYAFFQLYAYIKEYLNGMHEMVSVTKYGHGKMMTLRMAYASLLSMVLLLLVQMIVGNVQTVQYQKQMNASRMICFLACGLFIYCAVELLVRLMTRIIWARLIVPATWLVMAAFAITFSGTMARSLERIPTVVLALTAGIAMVIYVIELRIQLTMKREEEYIYAFN